MKTNKKILQQNFWKELSFCLKLKFYNPYISATWFCKPLIIQTQTVWFDRIQGLKYQTSTLLGCKDYKIRVCDQSSVALNPIKKKRKKVDKKQCF